MCARRFTIPMLFSMMLAGTVLQAQSTSRTTFGLLIGGTAAKITDIDLGSADVFNGTSKQGFRFGLDVGAFVNRSLNDRISFQPEAHYIQKGTVLDFGGPGQADGSLKLAFTYVEMPLLLRIDLGSRAAWRPFITAGPTFAMRIGCTGNIDGGDANLSVDCKEFDDNGTSADPFQKTDIGASVGAGLTGMMGKRPILAQLRYGRGLTTFIKDPGAGESPKHSVISFIVGVSR